MRYLLFVLALLIFSLAGCSSGSSNPLAPQNSNTPATSNIGSALGIFGAYELSINPDNNSAELIVKRASAIGESYTVSGISYFTIAPCTDCLSIASIGITNEEYIALAFNIKHPFQPGTGDVPSAKNRLDLDIFDLALVVAPQDISPQTSFAIRDIYSGICVDADGYTTELANLIDDSAALPYFLAVDDSIGGVSTFNKFAMGAETEFDMELDLSGDTLCFDLYLTMGYGWSAIKEDRLQPTYYNPEFNKKSAWKIVVTPPEGDDAPVLGNTWQDDNNTAEFDVTVEVYDWQIGANVDSELTNTGDIYTASDVATVSMEIPGMTAAYATVNTPDSGTGMPDAPLVYTISMANENYFAAGEHVGLIRVVDERIPLAPPPINSRDYLIDSPNGATLENYEIPDYATYQTFTATVVEGPSTLEGWLCYSHDPQHTGVADCVLDPASLVLKWTFQTGNTIISSPVISDGITYFGSNDSIFYAIDLASGTEVWSHPLDSAIYGTAAIGRGAIYIGSTGGYFYSLRKSDGGENWQYQFTFSGGMYPSGLETYSATLVNGRVYFSARNGNVYGLNAANGDELFVARTPISPAVNALRTTPAYYEAQDQLIVIAECKDIICFDAFDGTEIWREPIDEVTFCSPTLDGDDLYFFDITSAMKYSMSGTTPPTLLWTELLTPHQPIYVGSGALDDGHYYSVTLMPGKLHAHNHDTGYIDWVAPPDTIQGFDNASAISGNVIYCASSTGLIYGFDTTTGTEVFRAGLGNSTHSSVAIHDGYLLVGCCDGKMYCFGS